MYTQTELKVFEIIDNFLNLLQNSGDGSVHNIGEDFYSKESQIAYNILCNRSFITFRKNYRDINSLVDISSEGIGVLKSGGYQKFIEAERAKEEFEAQVKALQLEKTRIDIELSKNMLKDYPITKWMARASFFIALAVAIFQLVKFFTDKN